MLAYTARVKQARPTFDVVQAAAAKLCLHAGNVKFSTQNEE